MLMLVLLMLALLAARATMAHRLSLRGPWYQKLLPAGAVPDAVPIAPHLHASETSFRIGASKDAAELTFCRITEKTSAEPRHPGKPSAAEKFIQQLFPKGSSWHQPLLYTDNFPGTPVLIGQGYQYAHGASPAIGHPPPVAFRFLAMRAGPDRQVDVAVFGANRPPSARDDEFFAALITALGRGNR